MHATQRPRHAVKIGQRRSARDSTRPVSLAGVCAVLKQQLRHLNRARCSCAVKRRCPTHLWKPSAPARLRVRASRAPGRQGAKTGRQRDQRAGKPQTQGGARSVLTLPTGRTRLVRLAGICAALKQQLRHLNRAEFSCAVKRRRPHLWKPGQTRSQSPRQPRPRPPGRERRPGSSLTSAPANGPHKAVHAPS